MRPVSILRLHEEFKRQKQQIQKKMSEKSIEANKKAIFDKYFSKLI